MGKVIKNDRIEMAPRLSVGKRGEAGGEEQVSLCGGDQGEPEVRLHREGDLITAIEIHCACGRRMLLECDYEESALGLMASLDPTQKEG